MLGFSYFKNRYLIDLNSITDSYVPYVSSGGFSDSAISFDGTNIGVNTTSPTALFDLSVSSGENGYRLTTNGTAVGRWSIANAGVDNSMRFGTITNNEIQFYTNNARAATIGTDKSLDVVGDLTAATIQADNGADYSGALAGITNITVVGGVITAIS